MTAKIPEKESDIQRTILEWLAAKRIFHYRQNAGAVKTENRFFHFGTPGAPDIVAVVAGKYVGIERAVFRARPSASSKDASGWPGASTSWRGRWRTWRRRSFT
jgi:hypothetical protein